MNVWLAVITTLAIISKLSLVNYKETSCPEIAIVRKALGDFFSENRVFKDQVFKNIKFPRIATGRFINSTIHDKQSF